MDPCGGAKVIGRVQKRVDLWGVPAVVADRKKCRAVTSGRE